MRHIHKYYRRIKPKQQQHSSQTTQPSTLIQTRPYGASIPCTTTGMQLRARGTHHTFPSRLESTRCRHKRSRSRLCSVERAHRTSLYCAVQGTYSPKRTGTGLTTLPRHYDDTTTLRSRHNSLTGTGVEYRVRPTSVPNAGYRGLQPVQMQGLAKLTEDKYS